MRTSPVAPNALAPLGSAPRKRAHPRQTFLQVFEEGASRAPDKAALPDPVTSSATGAAPAPTNGGLRALVTRTLRAEDRIDHLIASAAAGKTFSAGQLLALQATTFRYSQTIEVLSRAADRLVGSIKQTLGTQV